MELCQFYSANDFLGENIKNIFLNSRIVMIIMIKYIKNKRVLMEIK